MYVCMYVWVYKYIHSFIHSFIYALIHSYVYIYIYIYLHTRKYYITPHIMYMHMYVDVDECVSVYAALWLYSAAASTRIDCVTG